MFPLSINERNAYWIRSIRFVTDCTRSLDDQANDFTNFQKEVAFVNSRYSHGPWVSDNVFSYGFEWNGQTYHYHFCVHQCAHEFQFKIGFGVLQEFCRNAAPIKMVAYCNNIPDFSMHKGETVSFDQYDPLDEFDACGYTCFDSREIAFDPISLDNATMHFEFFTDDGRLTPLHQFQVKMKFGFEYSHIDSPSTPPRIL